MEAVSAPAPHILALDDDPAVRALLEDYLGGNDLRVTAVASGTQMHDVLARQIIDLLILDLRLPGEDGMHIVRTVRERSAIPIIMLTGRNEEADRVMGLELGADDYLTKPFSPRELLARVRALLRRAQTRSPGGESTPRAARVPLRGLGAAHRHARADARGRSSRSSSATASSACWRRFLGAPQRILSRDQLLELSRLHGDDVYDRAIDVQILRLRRKLEGDPARPTLIVTERGAGYVLKAGVETVP